MSKNREIEAKTLLPKNTYDNLCKDFAHKEDFMQTNNYFDTSDQVLKKHQASLRIRIYEDHAEQTLKVPDLDPVQKHFHEVIEINDILDLTHAQNLVDLAKNGRNIKFEKNVGEYLDKKFNRKQNKLELFTWSKTHRILANGPENCELTLDATSYPDGYQDFELEIENKNPALIKKVQITLQEKYGFTQTINNQNKNKIARATIHKI